MTTSRRTFLLARCASIGSLLFGAGMFIAITATGALPLVWAIPLLALVVLVAYALLLAWDILPIPQWMLRRAREELGVRGGWDSSTTEGHDADER